MKHEQRVCFGNALNLCRMWNFDFKSNTTCIIKCHYHEVLQAHAENLLICTGINMINIPSVCTLKLRNINIKSLTHLRF